ncbi:MAG: CCA tRNA nucleotidyltransferase [Chlamydiae bacterium]|nr:CCA tRNA nucleotidyltransferase [Chlamydiota bacterium]
MTLYNIAKKIVQKFVDHGHTSYFAGGWVRDFLMKHPSNDIDIVTSASVEETQKLFPKTIPVGINFGIIVVVYEGHHFEVAMFRKESGYGDGRRPQNVSVADPKEDALRRDFTINGMFYDPIKDEIYDYVGGENDLKLEVVRAIGNAHERFLEDRLRMVRAVRYAARFRFAIDPKTIEAILFHSEELFPAVAIERVWQEFEKMAKVTHFDEALVMLHRLNLLQVIFPTIAELDLETIEERVKFISLFPKKAPVIAKIYELFPRNSLKERLIICDYLKLSNQDKKFTEELDRWYRSKDFDDYELAKMYALPNASICFKIALLHNQSDEFSKYHTEKMKKLSKAIVRIQEKKQVVSANDLMKKGVLPGKELGKMLEEAEKIAINLDLQTPKEVMDHLKF